MSIEERITDKELAGLIDHTLLEASVSESQIKELCAEAVDYGFYSVCVSPRWVSLAAEQLEGTGVKVGSVVSFPLGADTTKIKAAQAHDGIFNGADEIDMVADLTAIIDGNERYLFGQLQAVKRVCDAMRPKVVLKVIIESAALNDDAKLFVCEIAQRVKVDFIKTSTGLHSAGGAKAKDVRLIKEAAPDCRVKAAGGIRTLEQALEMLEAGADRIGTSSGVVIINQLRARQQ